MTTQVSAEAAGGTLIISSDGHAVADMADYRSYLPARLHRDFDEFLTVYEKHGARNTDTEHLALIYDSEAIAKWQREVVEPGHLLGTSDPRARINELDRNGISGEVIFPDFGLPFEIGGPVRKNAYGHHRTLEEIDAANKAHNRWMVDFCSHDPRRLVGLAAVSFHDVDGAVNEIRWAKEAGLKGIVLPTFTEEEPLYDPQFEPIWSTLEELGMPANSHPGISSTTDRLEVRPNPALPRPVNSVPIFGSQFTFFVRQIFNHLVWGGVLERHPGLRVVFTEQGSGWTVGELESMDFSYEGSYLSHDLHDVVRHRPSEYFRRQCFLGSSIFSRAEVEARHRIGIDKMALGMDYPHHEGAWAAGPGTLQYLQATLGAAAVPPYEARRLLAENAAELWEFDTAALASVADRIGPQLDDVLSAPHEDRYPRGDVKKPLGTAH
jgi:predicted TIM-barrel fold metal-dependent hydrolase